MLEIAASDERGYKCGAFIKSVETDGRVEIDLDEAVGIEGAGLMTTSSGVLGYDRSGDGRGESQLPVDRGKQLVREIGRVVHESKYLSIDPRR